MERDVQSRGCSAILPEMARRRAVWPAMARGWPTAESWLRQQLVKDLSEEEQRPLPAVQRARGVRA